MFLPVIKPVFRLALKIVSVVIFVLTIIIAYCGRINPEFFSLPAVLVLVLPYLGLATLIITILWFVAGRWIFGGLGAGTLILCWASLSNVMPVSFSSKPSSGATTFKLLTFNCLHLDDIQHPDASGNRALRFLTGCGADIICLQELVDIENGWDVHNFSKSAMDSLMAVYPYHAGDVSCDLKVFSKYPVTLLPMKEFPPHPNTNVNFYRLNIKGKNLTIANMHLNSYNLTDKEREVVTDMKSVSSAKESISELKGTIRQKLGDSFRTRVGNVRTLTGVLDDINGPLIVCGDFNDVPESYCYRMMRNAGFKDAYVETGFGPMYTYNQHLFLFHLDQIFYKGGLKALSVKKERIKTSDHYPLMAEFEFTD